MVADGVTGVLVVLPAVIVPLSHYDPKKTLQQYASMILEKTLADESPDDLNFLNACQSSPFVPSFLTPGISRSFIHPHISAGLLQPTRPA